ncbi:MAG: helix-turn-helix domain-containing protein [Acidimicrobiales bacterium]
MAPIRNVRLRQAREAASLTQGGLALAIRRLEAPPDGALSGLDRSTVARWESGAQRPSARYRPHLEQVLGRSAVELGLVPVAPDVVVLTDRGRAATLEDVDFDTPISRRRALAGALGVGLVGLLPGTSLRNVVAGATGRGTSTVGPEAVAHYRALAQHLSAYYWVSPDAEAVHDHAVALAQEGVRLLRSASGQRRQAIASAAGQVALLAGRIAFFDLDRPAGSTGCYRAALELAEEADERALQAAVYAHVAFIPGFSGDFQGSEEALERAVIKERRAGGPLLRSWLHCVRAELAARCGHTQQAADQVRRAEESLASSGSDPVWLDWYDTARLAAFRGYVEVRAGRHDKAIAVLSGALDGLAPNAGKQRAVVRFDLAAAYAPVAPELALDQATLAIQGLADSWYATAAARLPGIEAALEGTSYVDQLQERAHQLLPVGAY